MCQLQLPALPKCVSRRGIPIHAVTKLFNVLLQQLQALGPLILFLPLPRCPWEGLGGIGHYKALCAEGCNEAWRVAVFNDVRGPPVRCVGYGVCLGRQPGRGPVCEGGKYPDGAHVVNNHIRRWRRFRMHSVDSPFSAADPAAAPGGAVLAALLKALGVGGPRVPIHGRVTRPRGAVRIGHRRLIDLFIRVSSAAV